MAAPMAILLTVSLATAARMASTACVRLRVSGVRRTMETVTASTSTSPTTIAPATAPVAPNASPTARPSTMITARKTANPTTDRRSNGLRNFTLRYSSRSACCQIIQATANPSAVSAAAMSAGATSTRSSTLSAATMPTTRRNMTADATATPAASNRGGPSRWPHRRGGGNAPGGGERISAESKGQHAGDCRRRGEMSGGLVLGASEEGDDGAVGGERHAENNGEGRGAAYLLFRHGQRQR